MPGLAYQMGILIAAPTNSLQTKLRHAVGYPWALAAFEGATILLLSITLLLGKEQHGRDFVARQDHSSP
jgi:hypothetical protein